MFNVKQNIIDEVQGVGSTRFVFENTILNSAARVTRYNDT